MDTDTKTLACILAREDPSTLIDFAVKENGDAVIINQYGQKFIIAASLITKARQVAEVLPTEPIVEAGQFTLPKASGFSLPPMADLPTPSRRKGPREHRAHKAK